MRLSGDSEDVNQFVEQAEQFSNIDIGIDGQGNLSTLVCGLSGAAAALTNAIDASQMIGITAVSNDVGVQIDQFTTFSVDVADIQGLADVSADLGAATFTHALAEYTTAVETGGNDISNYFGPHDRAIIAESAIMGAATRTNTGSLNPLSPFGVQYLDASGATVSSFSFTTDFFGTPHGN